MILQELRKEREASEKEAADSNRNKRQIEELINHKKATIEQESLAVKIAEVGSYSFSLRTMCRLLWI